MLLKSSISLLVLSSLLTLTAGVAMARNLDVRNGNTRVVIDQNGGIRVESGTGGSIVLPNQRTTFTNRYPLRATDRPSNSIHLPLSTSPNLSRSTPNLSCQENHHTEQSNQTNRSNGAVGQTYMSTTTTVCH
ncbi:MAG TPA: hypothetical protein V6D10_09515 [Trichocoleus sp.]|jgi:hypothetical protein